MKTAGDIIAANRQEVWSIPSRATVFEALKLMSDKNVGALPVRDVIEALIREKNGLVESLRDISQTLFTQGFDDHLAGGKG